MIRINVDDNNYQQINKNLAEEEETFDFLDFSKNKTAFIQRKTSCVKALFVNGNGNGNGSKFWDCSSFVFVLFSFTSAAEYINLLCSFIKIKADVFKIISFIFGEEKRKI